MSRVISLSTCWCSHRHSDGYKMLQEMADLGFEYVELSHGIRITVVEGILKAVAEGMVKISSVHNFCPLPAEVTQAAPNYYLPSAPDPRERRQWVRYTRRTFNFAQQLGATLVVIHCGRLQFLFGDPERKLSVSLRGREHLEPVSDRDYKKILDRVMGKLEKKAVRYMDYLRSSIGEILPLAKERGLRLGIENREGITEIPLDREMAGFIKDLDELETVGYWHDTGHAQIKEQFGIIEHKELLSNNQERLLGFHLHDVSLMGRDHLPLGSGQVDFEMVKTFIRPEHLLILEMGPYVSSSDVAASRRYLLELLKE